MKTAPNAQLEVRAPQFQGPLGLLLLLIQKREVEIEDLPIADIADQYLNYLNLMQSLDIDIASEYLVMASTLLFLKSQSVLPSANQAAAEKHPEAQELLRQLIQYKRFKEAAQYLEKRENRRANAFTRPPDPGYEQGASKEYRLHATLFDLIGAFQRAVENQTAFEFYDDFQDEPLEEEAATVEEKIYEILDRLEAEGALEFAQLFLPHISRLELVCVFLAVLELARMRQIAASQEEPLGPIRIELIPDRPELHTFELSRYDEQRQPHSID